MQFNLYLTEAASEEKLTHLEHAEDHVINDGMEVIFDLITSGRFSKSQEMMVKEFSARIQYVEAQL